MAKASRVLPLSSVLDRSSVVRLRSIISPNLNLWQVFDKDAGERLRLVAWLTVQNLYTRYAKATRDTGNMHFGWGTLQENPDQGELPARLLIKLVRFVTRDDGKDWLLNLTDEEEISVAMQIMFAATRRNLLSGGGDEECAHYRLDPDGLGDFGTLTTLLEQAMLSLFVCMLCRSHFDYMFDEFEKNVEAEGSPFRRHDTMPVERRRINDLFVDNLLDLGIRLRNVDNHPGPLSVMKVPIVQYDGSLIVLSKGNGISPDDFERGFPKYGFESEAVDSMKDFAATKKGRKPGSWLEASGFVMRKAPDAFLAGLMGNNRGLTFKKSRLTAVIPGFDEPISVGRGVFAEVDIPKNTAITWYAGPYVGKIFIDRLEKKYDDTVTHAIATRFGEWTILGNYVEMKRSENYAILKRMPSDIKLPGGYPLGAFINDARNTRRRGDYNVEFVHLQAINSQNRDASRMLVVSKRDIPKGEELLVNYRRGLGEEEPTVEEEESPFVPSQELPFEPGMPSKQQLEEIKRIESAMKPESPLKNLGTLISIAFEKMRGVAFLKERPLEDPASLYAVLMARFSMPITRAFAMHVETVNFSNTEHDVLVEWSNANPWYQMFSINPRQVALFVGGEEAAEWYETSKRGDATQWYKSNGSVLELEHVDERGPRITDNGFISADDVEGVLKKYYRPLSRVIERKPPVGIATRPDEVKVEVDRQTLETSVIPTDDEDVTRTSKSPVEFVLHFDRTRGDGKAKRHSYGIETPPRLTLEGLFDSKKTYVPYAIFTWPTKNSWFCAHVKRPDGLWDTYHKGMYSGPFKQTVLTNKDQVMHGSAMLFYHDSDVELPVVSEQHILQEKLELFS